MARHHLQRAAIFIGGFIGPFIGQSLAVILPEFSQTFGISLHLAALTLTAYMVPFATMMLVSTRLVRTVSPTVVVTAAMAVTAIGAGLLCIVPRWWMFLTVFMVMALANAFTTPVLQVILKRITPDNQLGAALGTFTAMQSLGVFSAPLIAGAAATVNWRLTYLLVVICAGFIVAVRLPQVSASPRVANAGAGKVNWPRFGLYMCTYLILGVGIVGMPFAVSLLAGEKFGLGSVGRGLVVMCGGLAAFVFSRAVGSMADKLGALPTLLVGLGMGVLGLFLVPVVPVAGLMGLAWAIALVGNQGVQVVINMLVLRSPRGTEFLSTVLAFRFFGVSLAPVIMMPVFSATHLWAFWGPALTVTMVCAVYAALGPKALPDAGAA